MNKIKVHPVQIHFPVRTINPCGEIDLEPRPCFVRPITVLKLRLNNIAVTDWVEEGKAPATYIDEELIDDFIFF